MAFMMTTMKGYAAELREVHSCGEEMNDAILDYIGGIKVIKVI